LIQRRRARGRHEDQSRFEHLLFDPVELLLHARVFGAQHGAKAIGSCLDDAQRLPKIMN
jgi:hypothetical protein